MHRRRLLAICGAMVLLGAVPAYARTIAVVPRVMLRARAPSRLLPGSPGTLAHAIRVADEKRRWTRPHSEGALTERDPDGTCPSEMAIVDERVCVDRWEGALVEIEVDGSMHPWPPSLALDPARRYRAVSAPGVVPQGYISGEQAAAACDAAGKRLCEAAEWRLACAGSQGSVYPYGTRHVEGRCNDHGRAPMLVFHPEVARSWSLVSNTDMNDPRLNELAGTVARTGEHVGCVNDWGLFDMVGNLHEWTADPNGTFQGGYYLDALANGEGCAYRTTAHAFDYHDYSTGFRCCAELTPLPRADLEEDR
jgi:formylglycine-generating enzyme